ncbi:MULTISPECIES: tripartite tricarboxylate transporter substrate-binding protein [unclassified Beijerinckia]|uniref:Bug family tripartite tricarboxylate transporter substrate binding protein n=1 Tax=unclassified Beijerinckia TaxID=2638183 RepID=UPI00089A1094|nr:MULTISPECIES: tripartite tricarboxylate transporter substrate-binding protein [unclassified Beijerinckia]MDH7798160.1 tripartite-type tricarboxylate transporter receptor subunit TctC [Beijerinckia sp. GAS462]SED11165.1 Tripartite-type tricarboxylate transporter, receptor component TctC [Beijerinckia sp. 28-YEA-48]
MCKVILAGLVSVLVWGGIVDASRAESVEDFYKGKRITLYVGSSPGGGTDTYGRVIGQFLGNHLPGKPTVVVANMPGANGLIVANQLAKSLPKDGTALGTFDRNAALHSIWGNPAARFVAADLAWIGSANVDTSTCVTWHTTGIDTLEKFMTREVVLGSTAVYHANLLNSLFGAKLKQVLGYQGGNDVVLALERGEVQGRCNWSWSSIIATRPAWVRDKKINIVLQFAEEKHPELQDVPLVGELVKTPEQKQMIDMILISQTMARPFAAPPDVPEVRIAALREAFMAVAKDPDFIAAAHAQQLEVAFVEGARIQENIRRISSAPKALARELRDVMLGPEASAEMDRK